ncbi:MAG: Smr/MutS family protein [Alphaproteobacteria bacterium]|nr:Smr/MutS family protein [Alphaproteobacteria bacterium]
MARRLTPDELGLWRRAMHDVAPLRGRSSRPAPTPARIAAPEPALSSAPRAAAPKLPVPPVPIPLPPLDRHAGIDRASLDRLRRGRYPIEARLDLHGMTQDEAHRAVSRFVATSRVLGRRCVLVITGHGRMSGGVLKSAVPRWLNEPSLRHELLAVTAAQPRDGGSAALYLLLRRTRSTLD